MNGDNKKQLFTANKTKQKKTSHDIPITSTICICSPLKQHVIICPLLFAHFKATNYAMPIAICTSLKQHVTIFRLPFARFESNTSWYAHYYLHIFKATRHDMPIAICTFWKQHVIYTHCHLHILKATRHDMPIAICTSLKQHVMICLLPFAHF